MKRVRFIAHGREHVGEWRPDGTVADAAGKAYDHESVLFLPPVAPNKIVAMAANYGRPGEARDASEPPAVFLTPQTSLIGHRSPIICPPESRDLHYEVELAAVIGRHARRVRAADALDYVLGYTIVNDMTARDLLTATNRPPVRAKGWDSFTPLGPYLAIGEIDDPGRLNMRVYVNDELRLEANTKDMIHSLPEIIEHVTEFMTLEPGDVILTGAPSGRTRVEPGDVMRLEIDGLGALVNPLVPEADGEDAGAGRR